MESSGHPLSLPVILENQYRMHEANRSINASEDEGLVSIHAI